MMYCWMLLPRKPDPRAVRICILGNSHVAALHSAWAQAPGCWGGHALTFVAAPRHLLAHTRLCDGILVPTATATRVALQRLSGVTGVALDQHDAFVIVGASVTMTAAIQGYRDARWPGLPSLANFIRQSGQASLTTLPERLISAKAAQAIVCAALTDRLGLVLARLLRAGTAAPIFLVAQPRVSDLILTARSPTTRLYRVILRNSDGPAIAALFESAVQAVLAKTGTTFLPQPAQTLSHHILTSQTYMTGATRLGQTAPVQPDSADITHANALFGAVVLDQIIAAIGQLQPT